MIELGKKYQTRDGRAVRILCVDGPGEQPVVGLIGEMVANWDMNGIYFLHPLSENCRHLMEASDLILVPTKHEGWIAVADGEPDYIWQQLMKDTPESVNRPRGTHIAHVTWED